MNEIFDAYFNVRKHGIIRNIPLKYTIDGKKFRIFLENIKVDWTNFSTYDINGEKKIQIWDADRTLIGDQRYSIHYSVYGLIRNFAGKWREELSWNVVPNGFDTHIDQVRIELNLPKVYTWFTSEDFLIAADGKSNKVEDFEGTIDWNQGDKIILTYDNTIPAGNGITLAVKFPVGYFTFDHERQESLIDTEDEDVTIKAYIYVIVSWIIWLCSWFCFGRWFIVCLINQIKRRKFFKKVLLDMNEKYPLVIQYTLPKELNSAEVWFLVDECANAKHLSSLFYQWLEEWIITISYSWKFLLWSNITFQKIKNLSPKHHSHPYEVQFFNKIFKNDIVKISWFTWFSSIFRVAKAGLMQYWFCKWWFIYNKDQSVADSSHDSEIQLIGGSDLKKISYLIFGNILWFIFALLMAPTGYGILWAIPFIWLFFSIPLIFISWQYPNITEKWVMLKNHILGFKMFLEKCDIHVLETLLKQDPLYIDKILPYAVALGLDTVLLRKIKNLQQCENLYHSFSTNSFKEINSFISWFSRRSNSWLSFSSTQSSHSNHSDHSSSSSYDSDSWFSSWSSRDSGSSSGSFWGGWWWGGGRSW